MNLFKPSSPMPSPKAGTGANPPKPLSGPGTPGAPVPSLGTMSIDERLPAAAREVLATLDRQVAEAAAYLEKQHQDGGRLGFELDAVRTDYAPRAVNAYLALPVGGADSTPLQDGRTGAQLLIDQLSLLVHAVQRTVAEAAQSASTELRASERFLQDKYGDRGDGLSL